MKINSRDKTEQKEEDGTNDQNGAVLSNDESKDSGIKLNEDEVVLQASNNNPFESLKGNGATPDITEHEKSQEPMELKIFIHKNLEWKLSIRKTTEVNF